MSKTADKFEATRTVVETIQDFEPAEQEMIFRWAAESLGLAQPYGPPGAGKPPAHGSAIAPLASPQGRMSPPGDVPQDIKSFIAAKKPRSDVQFAATVAYYYQFVAPPSDKKTAITKEHLREAFRLVRDRNIPPHPDMTLNNAYQAGLLDREEKGTYAINSVGENFVTMTLPGDGTTRVKKNKGPKKGSARSGKGARKKPTRS